MTKPYATAQATAKRAMMRAYGYSFRSLNDRIKRDPMFFQTYRIAYQAVRLAQGGGRI